MSVREDLPKSRPREAPELEVRAVRRVDPPYAWSLSATERLIELPRQRVLSQTSRVFTMGSCFAEEVKRVLAAHEFATLPAYRDDYDPTRISAYRLGEANHTNHYHSFAILQEFEKVAGLGAQDDDDYWMVPDRRWGTGGQIWQDPYRRGIFARTREEIHAVTRGIDRDIRAGVMQADVFLLTLGLVEVWVKRDNGRIAGAVPGFEVGGRGGEGRAIFARSTFRENYDSVCRILDLIDRLRPGAHVVLTVSPVPMARTFTEKSCIVANAESKAILRAVAGEVVAERSNVSYFPSYEICLSSTNPYQDDGMHVRPDVVRTITDAFIATYVV